MAANRTAVLAVCVLGVGAASVAAYVFERRAGEAPTCPVGQLRLDEDGVATCFGGSPLNARQTLTAGAKLSLNAATADDLAAIDGVGPSLAHAIVLARGRSDGGFQSWDDVDRVPGVGAVRLQSLQAASVLEAR